MDDTTKVEGQIRQVMVLQHIIQEVSGACIHYQVYNVLNENGNEKNERMVMALQTIMAMGLTVAEVMGVSVAGTDQMRASAREFLDKLGCPVIQPGNNWDT